MGHHLALLTKLKNVKQRLAEYQIMQSLPSNFEDKLPSIEQIEQELEQEIKKQLAGVRYE